MGGPGLEKWVLMGSYPEIPERVGFDLATFGQLSALHGPHPWSDIILTSPWVCFAGVNQNKDPYLRK